MRWMVVGHGGIATAFVTAVSGTEGHEVSVVAGRSADRAGAFASRHGIETATVEMARHLTEVDAVYVATPHPHHAQAASAALTAGTPVLCEKPLTLSAATTTDLIDMARANDVFLMEAVWTRFHPIYEQVFDWIDGGMIGEIRGVRASFGFDEPFDASHRLFNPELGGGALYDIGIYPLHLAHWVLGQPDRLEMVSSHAPTGVDDYVAIIGTYAGGRVADLSATTRVELTGAGVIWGESGWIEIPRFWMAESASLHTGGRTEIAKAPFEINGYEYEILEVERCLRAGRIESDRMPWAVSEEIARQVDQLLAGG